MALNQPALVEPNSMDFSNDIDLGLGDGDDAMMIDEPPMDIVCLRDSLYLPTLADLNL